MGAPAHKRKQPRKQEPVKIPAAGMARRGVSLSVERAAKGPERQELARRVHLFRGRRQLFFGLIRRTAGKLLVSVRSQSAGMEAASLPQSPGTHSVALADPDGPRELGNMGRRVAITATLRHVADEVGNALGRGIDDCR